VASLVASIAYFKANKISAIGEKQSWIKLARISFLAETIAVFFYRYYSLFHYFKTL